MKLNLLIGGEAGQGLKTISGILGKSLFRMGYNVFTTKDYMSRVRGGHNFTKVRFGDEEVYGPEDDLDIIVALNEETITEHSDKLKKDGIILYEEKLKDLDNIKTIDAKKIAKEINPKAVNTVYVGAVFKILGLELNECKRVIKEKFKEEKVREDNLLLLKKGYEKFENTFSFPAVEKNSEDIYIDGNQAVGLGAVTAGVSFYSAYPMSPSTGIMNYIAGKQNELGIVVEQAEDEIGAINMALGASFSGIRAMTGTSGGGLALMAEGVGLSGVSETPLVIAEVQRPGPATGLPTRTSQGDLLFAINISQGEFPIMIIAPRNQKDAFYQTFRAHNLAEKYQIPVIILSDQFLADSATNVKEFNMERLNIERNLIDKNELEQINDYQRYQITDNGISPRVYPGQFSEAIVLTDSHEHDQKGHATEDEKLRQSMVKKRSKKITKLKNEDLIEPEYCGQKNIDYLLVGWGSTYGPMLEAKEKLEDEDIKIGCLSFNDIWPLPTKELEKWCKRGVKMVNVENNFTAQLPKIIKGETGIEIEKNILKYTGRPFTGSEIAKRFMEEVISND